MNIWRPSALNSNSTFDVFEELSSFAGLFHAVQLFTRTLQQSCVICWRGSCLI